MGTPADAPAKKPRIERLPALPPAGKNYHKLRKRIHLICVVIFVALPFFNVMRFDIPRQRFYFAGFELWISEFGILFFSLMFLMFLIAASAIIHGRIYCSYACPQMIFSEWSLAVQRWARKTIAKRFPKWSSAATEQSAQAVFYGVLLAASVFLAFVFTSYFVEPRDLLARLMRLDVQTAGGITGATVTALTFLDFTLVRQKFCVSVCPYGYLQGILQDKNTLLVEYTDQTKVCIECKKCVRVCHMDIDIRKTPYQIECVHCGECIDACEDVMRRIGRPGLIHYEWGKAEFTQGKAPEAWHRRLGFRDAKRFAILLVLLFYLSGLLAALSMRRAVLVQVTPDRSTLYRIAEDGRVSNAMRLKLANRSSKAQRVMLRLENLPGAEIVQLANPVDLQPGETVQHTFEIRAPRKADAQDVNRFRLVAEATGEKKPETFDLTFIMPVETRGR